MYVYVSECVGESVWLSLATQEKFAANGLVAVFAGPLHINPVPLHEQRGTNDFRLFDDWCSKHRVLRHVACRMIMYNC